MESDSPHVTTEEVAAPAAESALGAAEDLIDDLHERLAMALQRVEALEAKLGEQEQQHEEQEQHYQQRRKQRLFHGRKFSSWDQANSLLPGGINPAIPDPVTTPATASDSPSFVLHRPFDFETFRRANSPLLQAERLRQIVPPDHFPMLP